MLAMVKVHADHRARALSERNDGRAKRIEGGKGLMPLGVTQDDGVPGLLRSVERSAKGFKAWHVN